MQIYKEGSFPTPCSCCGIVYDETKWKKLRYGGIFQGIHRGKRCTDDLELRVCPACLTTLAVKLTLPTDGGIRK